MKRAFDFTIALGALAALAPVMIAIALLIWLNDFRAPLYAGVRVASGGGEFRMLKFRTMRVDAWKSGVNSTSANDARITPIGRWLRRSKLDELPQLINVLAGDMSLVGPRPQVRADANLYTAEERRMLALRPGVTDLASIVFSDEGVILRDAADPDLLYNQIIRPWKSRLALLYLDRRTLALDRRILALTAIALLSREQALARVARLLRNLEADELLIEIAWRKHPLPAYPPPGASEICKRYAAAS